MVSPTGDCHTTGYAVICRASEVGHLSLCQHVDKNSNSLCVRAYGGVIPTGRHINLNLGRLAHIKSHSSNSNASPCSKPQTSPMHVQQTVGKTVTTKPTLHTKSSPTQKVLLKPRYCALRHQALPPLPQCNHCEVQLFLSPLCMMQIRNTSSHSSFLSRSKLHCDTDVFHHASEIPGGGVWKAGEF